MSAAKLIFKYHFMLTSLLLKFKHHLYLITRATNAYSTSLAHRNTSTLRMRKLLFPVCFPKTLPEVVSGLPYIQSLDKPVYRYHTDIPSKILILLYIYHNMTM